MHSGFFGKSARLLVASAALICFYSLGISAQQTSVVQPGAPGKPTKSLPASTKGKLPPLSRKDVEFMQGMIHHHAQAVEMTALIEDRTKNKDLRLIGTKISQSQTDEMKFMTLWLEARGQSAMTPHSQSKSAATSHAHGMPAHNAGGMKMSGDDMLMPGMLTKEQMEALRKAKGADFDRLFLTGMIQHHEGALVMVRDLFNTAGSGQDAELFNFATDVDTGQRAEIKSMQTLLEKNP